MENIAIPIVGILIAALLNIRYGEYKRKREKFDKEFSEFKNSFFDFLKCLESTEISLNETLLAEFLAHADAKRKFIHNLKGSRLKRFKEKWKEYEEEYYKVKNLGVLGVVAAITPDETSLINATTKDAQQWELDNFLAYPCALKTSLLPR